MLPMAPKTAMGFRRAPSWLPLALALAFAPEPAERLPELGRLGAQARRYASVSIT